MKTVYPLITFLSVALVAANPVPVKPGPVMTNSGIEGLNIPSTNFARGEDIAFEESDWITKRAIALRDAVSSLLTVRHDGEAAKTKASKGKKKGAGVAGANSNSTAAAAATNGTMTHTGKGKKGKGGEGGNAGNATAAATNATAAANNGTTEKKHHKAAAAAGGKGNGENANAKGGNGNGGNADGAQRRNDNEHANLIGDILGRNLRKREVRRSLNLWETEALRHVAGL